MFFLRIFQQMLLFSSMYFTLYFWGEDTYVSFNRILFYLLISTCVLQPVLDAIWKEKVTPETSLLIVMIIGVGIGLIFLSFQHYVESFIVLYITFKNIERVLYISCCIESSIRIAQIKLTLLYLIEFLSILSVVMFFDRLSLADRLSASVLAYFSLFYLYNVGKLRRERFVFNLYAFLTKYKESIGMLFYFLLSSLVLNMDRLFVDDIKSLSRSVSYLFYLSVFFAVFGLFGYNFDKIRKSIRNQCKINYIHIIIPSLIAFIGTLSFISLFNYIFPSVLVVLKVPFFNFYDVLSIFFLVFSVYMLMVVCTVYIQGGLMKVPLVTFSFIGFCKLSLLKTVGIVSSNYMVSLFSIILFFILLCKISGFKRSTCAS